MTLDHQQDLRAYAEQFRQNQRRLRETMRRVRKHIPQEESVCGALSHELVQDLESLRRQLEEHYCEEARGGCLEEAVSRCGSLAGEDVRLIASQEELLTRLDQVIAAAGEFRLAADRFHRRVREFEEQRQEHERAENRLLEFGFNIPAEDLD